MPTLTQSPTPAPTPTPTSTPTPSPTPTPTSAPTPSPAPTPTSAPTPSPTPAPVETPLPSPEPEAIAAFGDSDSPSNPPVSPDATDGVIIAGQASPSPSPDPHGKDEHSSAFPLIVGIALLLLVIISAVIIVMRQRAASSRRRQARRSGVSGKPMHKRGISPSATEKPAAVTQMPTEFARTPSSVTQMPAEFARTPSSATQMPAEFARTPSPDTRKPAAQAAPAKALPYRIGYAQTIGSRPNQEDSYGASTVETQIQERGLLAVVADGIGGLADGQVASGAVIRSMFSLFNELPRDMSAPNRLLRLAARAQSSVLDINQDAHAKCGSTLVTVLINGDHLSFLSIGDSRICLLRGGALLQLNREHKVGPGHDESMALGLARADIDARRRSALTSYIGKENLSQIDRNTRPLQLLHGDRILLMSDGVFGTLSSSELLSCMGAPAQQAAERVIAAVDGRRKPHQDNATIVIVEYV
ncbi:MAG: PP2C family protein-serine/threonine phosphatase [Candidatus Ventricola sp.]